MSEGHDYLVEMAKNNTRILPGHPEGYSEAFANIYSNFIDALLEKTGKAINYEEVDFPNAKDGYNGVRFINLCVDSSKEGAK